MRRFFLILIMITIPFSHGLAQRPLAMSDFYSIKQANHPRLSPDEKWIVYVISQYDSVYNRTNSHLWIVDTKSFQAKQLTFAGTRNTSPEWRKDSKTLTFVSNRSGDDQIWIMNIETLDVRQITDMEQGAWAPHWSPDGSKIVFFADALFVGRNPVGLYDIKMFSHLRYRWWYDDNRYDAGWRAHIFVIDVVKDSIAQLTSGDYIVDEFCISPDGASIAFTANRTKDRENNIDTDIWMMPAAGGDIEKVFENTGPDYTPQFSPDGKQLAWRSSFRYNYESDNYDVMVKELESGEVRNLAEDFDRVVRDLKWDRRNKDILLIAGDRGNYNLYEASVKRKRVKPLIESPQRIRDWDLSAKNETVILARDIPTRPTEIYMTELGSKSMKRISYANDVLLKDVQLQDPIPVTFPGDGNTPISGWYITPPNFDPHQKYPMVLYIHGGPQGMFKNQFDFDLQVTAAQGYVVFYTNPRGSFGYGQEFTDAINKDYGGVCYRDLLSGVNYMVAQGFVDPDRLGVTGLSFGGWMTAWIIGHTDKFKAAIPIAPFVNMLSFYGTTDEQFFPEWDFGGQPYNLDSRAVYEKNSPINFAQNFKTPTLIIHGEKDWRCPISEGEQLFTALKKMGVPAVLARVPDEPHVFELPNHIEATIRMKLDWWDKYLR
ncbi:S9 family peptidase [candidate division KSB1 bacterium]|nr:S9 family peptidase [candidate division KSB1 bacterium]